MIPEDNAPLLPGLKRSFLDTPGHDTNIFPGGIIMEIQVGSIFKSTSNPLRAIRKTSYT